MGWISARKMKTGCPLHSQKGKKWKDIPLRKIINHLNFDNDFFGVHTLLLECGHIIHGYGETRARCKKCKNGISTKRDKKELKEWRKFLKI